MKLARYINALLPVILSYTLQIAQASQPQAVAAYDLYQLPAQLIPRSIKPVTLANGQQNYFSVEINCIKTEFGAQIVQGYTKAKLGKQPKTIPNHNLGC